RRGRPPRPAVGHARRAPRRRRRRARAERRLPRRRLRPPGPPRDPGARRAERPPAPRGRLLRRHPRRGPRRDMRSYWQLTWTDFRLFLREPGAFAFTWGVPMALLVMNGVMWGNAPNPLWQGLGAVDASIPLFSSLIVASNGLMMIGVVLAT